MNLISLDSEKLTEIMKQAASQSASALQIIINQPVSLSFSQVKLIKDAKDSNALEKLIEKPGTVVKLKYIGGLKGVAFLIFANGQDKKLVEGLVEQDGSLGQTGVTPEVIFNEIANVLLNIYVGTIANWINARVDYDVPHLFIHEDKVKWADELISTHIPPQQLLFLKSSLGIGKLEIIAHIVIIMDYSSEVANKLC